LFIPGGEAAGCDVGLNLGEVALPPELALGEELTVSSSVFTSLAFW
jgi:hypothetical protein